MRSAIFLVLTAFCLLAQPSPGDWQSVRQLRLGTEVEVEMAAERIHGPLRATSDSAIVILHKGKDRSVPRSEVRQVERRIPPRWRKLATGVGVGVGFLAGSAVSFSLLHKHCNGSCDQEKAGIAGAMAGGPIGGGLIGYYAVGKGRLETVYRAP